MTALRWILGVIAAVFAGGFVFLVLVTNGFRRSFGASEHGPLFIGLPVVALALLLAALVVPACKPLLHLAAVAAAGLVAFCVWQIRAEGEGLWFALVYLAAWFVYYWLAAWRTAGPP